VALTNRWFVSMRFSSLSDPCYNVRDRSLTNFTVS
jgi:hypothetical protein